MRKLCIAQLDLRERRVFVRADFDVPLRAGRITDDTRIRAAIGTIRCCLDNDASVILASHLGQPRGRVDPRYSMKPVASRLAELLSRPVPLAPDCIGPVCESWARSLKPGQCLLLENLRFHEGEEANDPAFARALARLADCYVNDAFAISHSAHASVVAITRFLQPAAAGLLMLRELITLARVVDRPKRPLVMILGGTRIPDKFRLIGHLLGRVDRLLIGGAVAFTFLQALGCETGRSLVEPELLPMATRILADAPSRGVELLLPEDVVVAATPEDRAHVRSRPVGQIPSFAMGLDIGPASVARFRGALRDAATVLWNGPMGAFENPAFAGGTIELARAVAGCRGLTVAGGGDTVAAIQQAGVADRMGYLSTAGEAFLEFLEGRELPGVEALTDVCSVRQGAA